jgi:predicted SprT family Zn-dependent metalloprotease
MTSHTDPEHRQEDPDTLWKMIKEKDAEILKLKGDEHWYDSNSGRGDSYTYNCKCGYSRHEKEKLNSHIAWKLAQLQFNPKEASNV